MTRPLQDMPYKYLIYGREVGDEGTPHLQGYVQLKKITRLTGMKKLHPTAHWEVAKGTEEQNRTYCSKEGDFQEFGTPRRPKVVLAPLLNAPRRMPDS